MKHLLVSSCYLLHETDDLPHMFKGIIMLITAHLELTSVSQIFMWLATWNFLFFFLQIFSRFMFSNYKLAFIFCNIILFSTEYCILCCFCILVLSCFRLCCILLRSTIGSFFCKLVFKHDVFFLHYSCCVFLFSLRIISMHRMKSRRWIEKVQRYIFHYYIQVIFVMHVFFKLLFLAYKCMFFYFEYNYIYYNPQTQNHSVFSIFCLFVNVLYSTCHEFCDDDC